MNNIPTLPVIEPAIYAGLIKFLNKAIEEDDQESFIKLLKLQLRIRTLELARERFQFAAEHTEQKAEQQQPPSPTREEAIATEKAQIDKAMETVFGKPDPVKYPPGYKYRSYHDRIKDQKTPPNTSVNASPYSP